FVDFDEARTPGAKVCQLRILPHQMDFECESIVPVDVQAHRRRPVCPDCHEPQQSLLAHEVEHVPVGRVEDRVVDHACGGCSDRPIPNSAYARPPAIAPPASAVAALTG